MYTLAQYLDCGGNYDQAAAALVIHRSTLRYRLRRIRELTNLDLADVDGRIERPSDIVEDVHAQQAV